MSLNYKMIASKANLCIRCKKERIVVKTWEEKINDSKVVFTTTSCPDLSCQKVVDQENEKVEQRKVSFMFAKAQTQGLRTKPNTQAS